MSVSGDTPSIHPALYLLERLLARVAAPAVSRGRVILFLNGGRITNQHASCLLPEGAGFDLHWVPLNPAQRAVVQAVADLLPKLERARVDGQLVVRIRHGQPRLPLIFQGRYPVIYDQHATRSRRLTGR
jgi:hypothetical protein